MKTFKRYTVLLLMFVITSALTAQLSISPSFVFVDENNGVGNMFVSNSSDKSYEVTINFAFGYPGSDSEGNMVMNYTDSVAYAKYALDPFIRAFPRSFIIKGGAQRTVRIQVLPGKTRREGFFYTRMKVLAKPQTADVTDTVNVGIGTKINFNFEQITAVFYHKGMVTTGVKINELDVRQNKGVLELRPHLTCTGNAPFLGSMFAKLKDADGKVVAETQSTTTVYSDVIRRMDLKIDKVGQGTYTLELSLETKRNDMQSSDLIQSPKVIQEKTVVIQ